MNFYPFHIGDYASDTRHLSWAEDLAYRRLLDVYYVREGPLPLELRQVYRLVIATTDDQRQAVETVLEEFFQRGPDGFTHKRCESEIARMQEKSQKARASALISVEVRAKTREQANSELRKSRLSAAKEKATHTPGEWKRMVEACGNSCVRCGASGVALQKDHIVPIYQGGSDGIGNLQPLCKSCNSSKGAEATDHRPEHVRLAFADAVASERSAFASERLAPKTNPKTTTKEEANASSRSAYAPPDWVPVDAWAEFVKMRKAMRNVPFTGAAAQGVVAKLNELRSQGHDPAELLMTAVTSGWRTVYAPTARAGERPADWRTEQRQRTQQAAPGVAVRSGMTAADFFDTEARDVTPIALG